MILGKSILKEIYKDKFDEEQYTPNGIDLRLKKVYFPSSTEEGSIFGLSDGEKILPNVEELQLSAEDQFWVFEPGFQYFINCGHMDIPEGVVQLYTLRSTLMRCGMKLESCVGDSGYSGDLVFGLTTSIPTIIPKNERVVQALSFEAKDAGAYDGDYQNNKLKFKTSVD